MKGWSGYVKLPVFIVLLGLALLSGGCEGTDTREQVDDTVNEMAGKKDLDRYQQMKADLDKIQTRQAEKYNQLDNDSDTH